MGYDPRLAASMVGKRLSTSDPLTPHDVAERLDKALLRVWKILLTIEKEGEEYADTVRGSRYLTNAGVETIKALHTFFRYEFDPKDA